MSRVNHGITSEKSTDAIFAVMKDVTKLHEWSTFINSTKDLGGGSYEATTTMGPFNFTWSVDEGEKKCTMAAKIMGQDFESYFYVKDEDGKTGIYEDVPQNPMVSLEQIKAGIETDLNKLAGLA